MLLNLKRFRIFQPQPQPQPQPKRKFAMHATRKLWTWLAVICVLSFAVLGWAGSEIDLTAPPIPRQVISTRAQAAIENIVISAKNRQKNAQRHACYREGKNRVKARFPLTTVTNAAQQ
ncbi:hypothetical protein [Polaromonas sp.]|uniref:hypothetical protein n=1 Tax=Polaromonas sp. TaxID=1869339 RepID=UPI003BB6A126